MALLLDGLTWLANYYTTAFPGVLYTAWVVLALWDIARREDTAERTRLAWAAAVLFVPLAGPLAYLLLSDTRLSWSVRILVTAGGALVYLAISLVVRLAVAG